MQKLQQIAQTVHYLLQTVLSSSASMLQILFQMTVMSPCMWTWDFSQRKLCKCVHLYKQKHSVTASSPPTDWHAATTEWHLSGCWVLHTHMQVTIRRSGVRHSCTPTVSQDVHGFIIVSFALTACCTSHPENALRALMLSIRPWPNFYPALLVAFYLTG